MRVCRNDAALDETVAVLEEDTLHLECADLEANAWA
jgi:hypothetical protein